MSNAALLEAMTGVGDNALISAYVGGDERAFEILVGRYQNKLINYLNTLIHDYSTAVDLSQEAFIRVYRNAGHYKGEYQFSTWLYRIATNLAIDEMRRRKRKGRFFFHNVVGSAQNEEKVSSVPDLRDSPERRLDQKEKLCRLQGAVDALPEKYRLSFVLKEVQELSYQEIAKALRISQGTVKSRVRRAKLLLRRKLSELL